MFPEKLILPNFFNPERVKSSVFAYWEQMVSTESAEGQMEYILDLVAVQSPLDMSAVLG